MKIEVKRSCFAKNNKDERVMLEAGKEYEVGKDVSKASGTELLGRGCASPIAEKAEKAVKK